MRFTQRAVIVVSVAIVGLAPAATTMAATPLVSAGAGAAQPGRHCLQVTATIRLGRVTWEISVNPKTGTAYVADGGKVSVISGRTNTVVANISAGGAPFGDLAGLAVDPKTNTIYATSFLADVVLVINGRTNTVEATIPVGGAPFGVAADPKTDTVYVANSGGDSVSVINGRTNTVTATIPMSLGPVGIAVNPKTDTAYATTGINGQGTVSVINGRTDTIAAAIPVGPLPQQVAVNPKTRAVYVANEDSGTGATVSVINGRTGTVTATLPVGAAFGAAADPKTDTAYISGAGTVSVIAPCRK